MVVAMASKGHNSKPLTGVIFEPFEEVKKELMMVPTVPQDSLARQKYTDDCEAAINEQINVEYNVSYIYHAMYAYFDRDNVALKGLAKFFKESSDEERGHAEKLMEYQNKRGGRGRLDLKNRLGGGVRRRVWTNGGWRLRLSEHQGEGERLLNEAPHRVDNQS